MSTSYANNSRHECSGARMWVSALHSIRSDSMRIIFIILLSIVFCSASASDWPSFKKDGLNSGITSDPVPDHPVIIWSAIVQRLETTPAVSSDLVYALGGNGSVFAIDRDTGQLSWQSQLEGWVFQTSAPASSGGKIFAATDSGLLAALDGRTGEVLWKKKITDKRFELPIGCIDCRLYLGEGSAYGKGPKKYFCYFENGSLCWNLTKITHGYQWCGACEAGGYLVFGGNDGFLCSVNRSCGAPVDEVNLSDSSRLSFFRENPGRIRASAAFRNGYVYTTSELSAQEGFAWKVRLNNSTGRFEDLGWSTPVGFSTSTPSVCNGRVYLGTGEHGHPGAMVCLNDSSGEQIWSYPVSAGVKSSPSVSTAKKNPRILFTASEINGSVYCLEDLGNSARLLWKLNPPDDGYILGGVAISDGQVYFGTEGDQHLGNLYCLADIDEWPQLHGGADHTGRIGGLAPHSNHTLWISPDIAAQPGSSVSVAKGKVFANCVDRLACLDSRSGKLLWTHAINSSGDYAFGFSPAYSNGSVFFTTDATYCLNASSGAEVWRSIPSSGRFAVDGGPAISEGRVVVSDWDGHHYYCLDEMTGKELWNFTVEGNAQSTPAIGQSRVVFSGWDWGMGGMIYCVSLENGSEIWSTITENLPCGSAAIQGDAVYMTTYNFEGMGDLLALSLANGSILWREAVSPTDSTPALADGRVYICGGCDGFSGLVTYCFDALRGDLIWKTAEDEKIGDWRCSPAYADGLLFASRANFTDYAGICALDADSGNEVWSYPGGGSSPAVAGGTLFAIGQGRMYAFGDPNQLN